MGTRRTKAIAEMNSDDYFRRPSKMAYHNLCEKLSPPPGTSQLLGLGLKFCIERPVPRPDIRTSIFRLRRQVRLREWLKKNASLSDNYIPNLYVPSKFDPPPASAEIEDSMMFMASEIEDQIAKNIRRRHFNLSKQQRHTLQRIQQDLRFIVVATDKNLGPAILERDNYIERVYTDHLDCRVTYLKVQHHDAIDFVADTKMILLQTSSNSRRAQ